MLRYRSSACYRIPSSTFAQGVSCSDIGRVFVLTDPLARSTGARTQRRRRWCSGRYGRANINRHGIRRTLMILVTPKLAY